MNSKMITKFKKVVLEELQNIVIPTLFVICVIKYMIKRKKPL
jgi:hypothetical protein